MSADLVYLVCLADVPVAAYSTWIGACADATNCRGVQGQFVASEPGRWLARSGVDKVWIVRLPVDGAPDVAHKPRARPRSDCAKCGRDVPLTGDGYTYRHTNQNTGLICPGGKVKAVAA